MATTRVNCHFSALLLVILQISSVTAVKIFRENCESMIANFNITDETLAKLSDKKIVIDENIAIKCDSSMQTLQTVCDLCKNNDISSKLFYVTCGMGQNLKSIFHNLKIKYEEIFDSSCLQPNRQENRLRSRPIDVVQLLEDMMIRFGWNKFVLITDIDAGIMYLLADGTIFQLELSNRYTPALIIPPSHIEKSLNSTTLHGMHFFVLCSQAMTQLVLQTSKNHNLLTSPQTWVILSDISGKLILQNVKIPYNSYVAVATTSDNRYLNKLQFLPHKAALIWTFKDQPTAKTCSKLKKFSTLLNFTTGLVETSNDRPLIVDLHEVYSVRDDKPLRFKYFGKWVSTNETSKISLKHDFPNMMRNLEGIQLRVVTTEAPPYIIFKNKTKSADSLEGIYGLLFKALADIMNFTFELTVLNSYGQKSSNGSWTGLFHILKKKNADIALSDLSITKRRLQIADFSSKMSTAILRLIYKIPDEKFHYRLYIVPFGWQIWALITTSIIISGVLIYITSRVSPNSARKTTTDPIELAKIKDQFSILDCLFAVYNGINQQGSDLEPREISGKIIFVSVYLSFVIIFSSYTSVFTSFLTVKSNKIVFESLKEIYDNKDYKIGVCAATSQANLFEDNIDPTSIHYKVWRRILEDPTNLVSHMEKGIERAYNHDFALITPKETTTYFLENNCSFEFSSENIYTDTNHWAYTKNFPYAETFNNYINLFFESGAIQRLQRMYKQDEIKFCESADVKPLGFKKVVSLYLLLAGASLFAAAVLAVEWLFRLTGQITGRKKKQDIFYMPKVRELNSLSHRCNSTLFKGI
uniref:Ionotropic glutamate receptor L-glutamate and glycine-binding domain-containing protein n=1 Tax=Strigamia maritima TaxID=126957 RepID=T1JPB5_STRMM